MKNCLVTLVVLVGCLMAAFFLLYAINMNFGRGYPRGIIQIVARWKDYADPDLLGLEVTIAPDRIMVEVPDPHQVVFKRYEEKGHWNLHAFYCDSHLDSPPEVIVAKESKDEDLELDLGHFVPSHPGKVVCVKLLRGSLEPGRYPTAVRGQTVSYPPPKGLIRPGMLECDLMTLPWAPDRIETQPTEVHVASTDDLSDGTANQSYFHGLRIARGNDVPDMAPQTYVYHSDRPDATNLLVTVYHGRVSEVTGGAEETADVPYTLPAPPTPPDTDTAAPEQSQNRSWVVWLFDLFFKK